MFNKMTSTQKQIVVGVKMVVFALLSWFFLYQLFYSEISLTFMILTAVGLVFWVTAVCMGILLLDKKILYPAFILSLLSFFIFFRGAGVAPGQFREALYYFVIMILVFLTFLIFKGRVSYDKKSRLKLNFWLILIKKGLALMLTAVCLLIAFAYYFSPSLGELSSAVEFEIPKSLIDKILKPISNFGPEARDFAYELIDSQIKKSSEPLKQYVPIALAVGLFLSLRILVIFLVPIIVLLSCLSMKLFTVLGVAKIITKSTDAENIEL